MFIRVKTVKRSSGTYRYTQLLESFRRDSDGMPSHRVIANLGDLDSLEIENLKTSLEASRKRRRTVLAPKTNNWAVAPKPHANLLYLDVAVAHSLWQQWGLAQLLDKVLPAGRSRVASSGIVEALAIQRLVDPDSKLAASRWFPTTALPELLGIAPKHFNNTRLHRVLDELDAAGPALMAGLPRLYRERDGLFASLFMDVSDAWFVGRGPALAARGKTKEGLIERKIGIVLLCNERGYPLRWQVIAGNCSDTTAMSEMLQAVSGLEWVGDSPVVLDRAMGRSATVASMMATDVRFLTALTRPEFSSYAPGLPWSVMQELAVGQGMTDEQLASEAARRAQRAGMKSVDEQLLVLDLGIVKPCASDAGPSAESEPAAATSPDLTVHAMNLCTQAQQALADGRHNSYAAAARALGVSNAVMKKYRQLARLPGDIQRRVFDGDARGRALADLIRIARLDESDAQRAAFETLLQSPPASKPVSCSPSRSIPDTRVPESASDELQVRVVAYFNPQRFVEQRQCAHERVKRIEAFITELNTKLLSPQSRHDRDKIVAAVDARLRRDNLLGVFHLTIDRPQLNNRPGYQVRLQLDQVEWTKRRRYDGFSVLVGHPKLAPTAIELCQLYRAKDMVEKDFQVIKSVLEVRPIRHRTDNKVRAHVTLCMLALLIERTLREKLGRTSTVPRTLELLEQCRLNRYGAQQGSALYSITHLCDEQRAILRKVGLIHLADDEYFAETIEPR